MLDLKSVPQEILIARGEYSTVRAAHEDAKKELAKSCGVLQMAAGQILRSMQPDNDGIPGDIGETLQAAKDALTRIEQQVEKVGALAKQRANLKKIAWQ
jgi:hypothetical protein